QHYPPGLRVRVDRPPLPVRSRQGAAVARRGRVRWRLRRRRVLLRRVLYERRRGRGLLLEDGRDPDAATAARAGGLLRAVPVEEAPERDPGRERRVWQRGHADRGVRGRWRRVRLRELSRHRRAIPGAGGGDGPEETRGDPREDPA